MPQLTFHAVVIHMNKVQRQDTKNLYKGVERKLIASDVTT